MLRANSLSPARADEWHHIELGSPAKCQSRLPAVYRRTVRRCSPVECRCVRNDEEAPACDENVPTVSTMELLWIFLKLLVYLMIVVVLGCVQYAINIFGSIIDVK